MRPVGVIRLREGENVKQNENVNGNTEVLMGKMKERENKPVSQDAKDWTINFMECSASKLQKTSDFAVIKNKLDELTPELKSEALRYLEGFNKYATGWSDKDSEKEKTLKSISLVQQIIQNQK